MPAAYDAPEKRAHLVAAAVGLVYEQGLARTTLAQVARRAAVPLGNVYYYFKTKDALAEAVIAAHAAGLRERFAGWTAAHRDPRARLHCLVRAPLGYSEQVVRLGCPHGSLCQELDKLGDDAPLARAAGGLLAIYIAYADEQLQACGVGKRAAALMAQELVASLQGTMLLAHALRSPELLARQLRRLEHSLDDSLRSHSSRS